MKRNIIHTIGFSIGTVFNSILGLFFYLIAARTLGPADFGHFSYILGIGMLISEFSDWGFGSAIVKFGSGDNLDKVLGVAIVQRLSAIAIIFLGGFLATIFLGDLYFLSAFVATTLSLLVLPTQALLAKQKYSLYVGTNILGNSVRLILTAGFMLTGLSSVIGMLLAFSGASLIAFLVSFLMLILIEKKLPFTFKDFKVVLREILGYTNWLGSSFALSSLAAKIDIPFVYALSGPISAGIYSSAQKLSSVFPQVAVAIEGVFSPKFSSKEDIKSDFKDYLVISLLACLGLLLIIPLSSWIIPLFFGEKYISSVPVFKIFILGLAIFFLSGPFTAKVLYKYGKSKISFFGSLGQLIIGGFCFIIFVPGYEAVGAAWTYVVVQGFNFIYYFFYGRK